MKILLMISAIMLGGCAITPVGYVAAQPTYYVAHSPVVYAQPAMFFDFSFGHVGHRR